MLNDRFVRLLIWLLIIATAIFLLERLFVLITRFATPLLLFGIAWLIALALRPLVDWINGWTLPIPFLSQRTSNGVIAPMWNMPRSLAVLLVYVAFIAIVVLLIVLLVPVVLPQLVTLQDTLPNAVDEVSKWATVLETQLSRVGYYVDLAPILRPEALAQQAATIGTAVVQQSVSIASGIASLLINLVLVLILSFYMALDGPRMATRLLELLPAAWRNGTQELLDIIDRTFGGFLRAQLVQALAYGLATAVMMLILNLQEVALASLFATILVLIPLIGGVFAMIPPLVIALIQAPNQFLPLLVGLIIIQQVLFNVIMPRMMGKIVGLHPLLVFAAILVGATLAGAWGILFGIPIAGVVASVLQFIYLRTITARSPTVADIPKG